MFCLAPVATKSSLSFFWKLSELRRIMPLRRQQGFGAKRQVAPRRLELVDNYWNERRNDKQTKTIQMKFFLFYLKGRIVALSGSTTWLATQRQMNNLSCIMEPSRPGWCRGQRLCVQKSKQPHPAPLCKSLSKSSIL